MFSKQHLEYVSRDRAKLLAVLTRRAEWSALAKAPTLYMVVDGVRYRCNRTNTTISFPATVSSPVLPGPTLAG